MDEIEYQNIIKNIGQYSKYIYREGQLYLQKNDTTYRIVQRYEFEALMYLFHDHPTSAHFGVQTTYEKIKERYYWKNMLNDIKAYIQSHRIKINI